ncbi:helix-turn-helix domain-containing protein [Candidatus Uhrbacteria bacterium UHB]|nr:helix-turn-helix domain-containing protein [Candidatus Uhrbacteria bacterium UHB]RIL00794.1 MAG: transcriptional regulator [Candidatus Uhrbacteria bacterium]
MYETALPEDLIDVERAAAVLRVSKGTVYHWIRTGYFPHYRIGRLFRVREKDLANFLRIERRIGATPALDVNVEKPAS